MASVASGLRMDAALLSFEFQPSIGINARKVERFGINIKSFREPLKRSIQRVMIPSFRANFAAEGRPSWAPLAERTVETRGAAGPILNRSGRLKSRITQLARWDITATAAAIKSLPPDVKYGGVHQAGASGIEVGVLTGRRQEIAISTLGGIPQRQFVMFQDEDAAKIQDIFADWLDERALAAGINLRGG